MRSTLFFFNAFFFIHFLPTFFLSSLFVSHIWLCSPFHIMCSCESISFNDFFAAVEYDDFRRNKTTTQRFDGNRKCFDVCCQFRLGLNKKKLHHKSGFSEYLSHFTQKFMHFHDLFIPYGTFYFFHLVAVYKIQVTYHTSIESLGNALIQSGRMWKERRKKFSFSLQLQFHVKGMNTHSPISQVILIESQIPCGEFGSCSHSFALIKSL